MVKFHGLGKNLVVANEAGGVPVLYAGEEMRGRGITVLKVVTTDTSREATVRDEIATHAVRHEPVSVFKPTSVVGWVANKPSGGTRASKAINTGKIRVVASEAVFEREKPVAFQKVGENALKVLDIGIVMTIKRREVSGIARKHGKTCFFCIVFISVFGVFEARMDIRCGDGFGKFLPCFNDVEVEFRDVVVVGWRRVR